MFEPGPCPPTEPQGKIQLRGGDSLFLVLLWDTSLHPQPSSYGSASGPKTVVLVALPREVPFPQSYKYTLMTMKPSRKQRQEHGLHSE